MITPSRDDLTPLVEPAAIDGRVRQLGDELAHRLEGVDRPLFIGLLRGALFFFADLIRAVGRDDAEYDMIRVRSYADSGDAGAATTAGDLQLDPASLPDAEAVAGRTVVLVDDIVDTGRTLKAVREALRARGATRVISVLLLDKPARRTVEIEADLVGFEIPDEFVVGYGLDCAGQYRTLAGVWIIRAPAPDA
jgi:hypoxanthine phosphoribosyltransferase